MADSVNRLKELLFQQESATLAELERRIERVSAAENEARARIAEGMAQLEQIRQLGAESRTLQGELERRLADLNARTGTPEALKTSVAEVIDDVIVEARQNKQEDLSRALAPMLVKTIKAELKNNQAEMVEALYPITGQLVKAYVASAMRDLTNRMNRSLHSNRFMLRIRSLFSGYSMAELALAESQQLEVEELYLIRRGSGELLRRWPEGMARSNSDIHMSGVLAAINDFAGHAFRSDGGLLRSFDVDDFTVFLRASPVYLLAAKCRGTAAPGVEGLIDAEFLAAVARQHEAEEAAAAGKEETRPLQLLGDLKSRLEAGIADRHEALSRAGMPFSPVRALATAAVLALLAGGGWWAWTTWEIEQTRTAARQAIEATETMRGYPVTLEVGARGQSIAVSGLAPSDAAKSDLLGRLTRELPSVAIADKGLAALPPQGPDLTPTIASVRREIGAAETRTLSSVEREIGAVESRAMTTLQREMSLAEARMAQAAAHRSLERAQRRLEDALPDLEALQALQPPARRGTVATVHGDMQKGIAALKAQAGGLRRTDLDDAGRSRASETLSQASARIRAAAGEIDGLIGERPRRSPTPQPKRTGMPLTEAAEETALAAERLATVAAAALQAGSIRIPEPPKIIPPSARDRLRDYIGHNAVFFGNGEEFRDTAKANAVIAEVARLAIEARAMVRIVGYTDERGGQSRNSQLAQARADKVAQALAARGVPRTRLVTVGRATGPDISPSTGPDSANRRVVFELGFENEPLVEP